MNLANIKAFLGVSEPSLILFIVYSCVKKSQSIILIDITFQ